jgi:hypothetical protein
MSKDCSKCVYLDVCTGRYKDESIQDCCVPEEPLRRLQKHTHDASSFIAITQAYISDIKSKSKYWSKLKY